MFRTLKRAICLVALGAIPLSTVTCDLPSSVVFFDTFDDWYCCGGSYDVYVEYDDYYYDSYGYVDVYY